MNSGSSPGSTSQAGRRVQSTSMVTLHSPSHQSQSPKPKAHRDKYLTNETNNADNSGACRLKPSGVRPRERVAVSLFYGRRRRECRAVALARDDRRHRAAARDGAEPRGQEAPQAPRNTIESLKKELETLEQQYAAMLSTKSSRSDGSHATLTGQALPMQQQLQIQQQQHHHSSLLLQKYMQMADVKTRLRSENDALYQINAGHMKIEGRMHQLLHTDAQLPRVSNPYRIRPLPDAEYSKVIVEARDDILRFMNAPGKLSSGVSVFGWADQRKVDGEELKFALEKHFPTISAYDLLQRSWGIFSSPERFPKIYTASLHVQFHELQRVNEDTVLFYRSIQAEGSSVDVKTVFLLTRLKINEGYMLLFRSIDKDRVRFREDEIHQVIEETEALVADGQRRQALWVEKYIWVIFKDEGPQSCVFHFGGSTTTDIWLKEVLFIALKWENMAVGPRITLTM